MQWWTILFAYLTIPLVALAQSTPEYRLNVSVNEVSLTFHAADARGLSINDLRLDDLTVLDNGRPASKILAFESLENLPIRAGILMDTSASMERNLPDDRAISIQYAQHVLRQSTDQAFVMDFGYSSNIRKAWTSNPAALSAAISSVTAGRQNPLGGTALFDSIFRACFNEFGKADHSARGNFILLFSDGEDNASHTSLQEVVNVCQSANTAIYAFHAEPATGYSPGPKTLMELASQTGGRVFFDDDPQAKIIANLHIIEDDLRNQYRLVYRPAELKHDGAFHHIELRAPARVDSIRSRSGYYAPLN